MPARAPILPPGWERISAREARVLGLSPKARNYRDPAGNIRSYRAMLDARANYLTLGRYQTQRAWRGALKGRRPPPGAEKLPALLRDAATVSEGALGPYVPGQPKKDRLPSLLREELEELGDDQYPLWRFFNRD